MNRYRYPSSPGQWALLVIVVAMAITIVGVVYYGAIYQAPSADELSLQTGKTMTSNPTLLSGQSICFRGIVLDNRSTLNSDYPNVHMTLTDTMHHTSMLEITNGVIRPDGTLLAIAPANSLSNESVYRVTIKPSGYLSQTVSKVTNILKQCASVTSPFRVGDLNNDGKITKVDVALAEKAAQGEFNVITGQVYNNTAPSAEEVARVATAAKSRVRDQ